MKSKIRHAELFYFLLLFNNFLLDVRLPNLMSKKYFMKELVILEILL
jgi:hypothetical protein